MNQIRRDVPNRLLHLGRQVVESRVVPRLGQKLQALFGRRLRELVEVERLVDLVQELVNEIVVRFALKSFRFTADDARVGSLVVGDRLHQEVQQTPRFGQPLVRLFQVTGVEMEHVLGDAPEMPAGIRVVTDIGHAVRRQAVTADGQDFVPDRRGNPRVDSVADDVVELAKFFAQVEQVGGSQFDVFESRCPNQFLALTDLTRRQVNSQESGFWQRSRHRDQVPAVAATEFEHARGAHVRGMHPHQGRNRRETIGVRGIMRSRLIRQLLVAAADVVARNGCRCFHDNPRLAPLSQIRDVDRRELVELLDAQGLHRFDGLCETLRIGGITMHERRVVAYTASRDGNPSARE